DAGGCLSPGAGRVYLQPVEIVPPASARGAAAQESPERQPPMRDRPDRQDAFIFLVVVIERKIVLFALRRDIGFIHHRKAVWTRYEPGPESKQPDGGACEDDHHQACGPA